MDNYILSGKIESYLKDAISHNGWFLTAYMSLLQILKILKLTRNIYKNVKLNCKYILFFLFV